MAESWRRRAASAFAVWTRLLPRLRPQRPLLVGATLTTVVVVVVELAKPWTLKVVIDQVLLGQTWDLLPAAWQRDPGMLLWLAVVATVLLAALGGLAGYWRDVWLAKVGQRTVARIRCEALDAVVRQPLAFHERHRAGDLLVRLCSDALSLRTLLVDGMFALGRESLLVVGTFVVMLVVDWRLALAAMLVLPVLAVLLAVFSVHIKKAARKQRKKEGELAASAHETLAATSVVQAYGLENLAVATFDGDNRRSARAGLAATRLEARLGATTDVALAIGTAAVLWLGVGRVQAGALQAGELVAMLVYARSFFRPIRKGLGRSAAMIKAAASAERVLELLAAAPVGSGGEAPSQPVPDLRGAVAWRDVWFEHADGRSVLRGCDLELAPGTHAAIVGPNGAGKTTLALLVARLREATRGEVQVDGIDVRRLAPAELRRQLAMVFQESVLFDGTLRDNVQLGNLQATPDEIERAADLAGVLQFAQRLPNGLDTEVGERGAELSGGERQRIALARALVRDAAIYVFDEPTTGLDADAERQLRQRVLPALRGKTVLVVTHDERIAACVDVVVRVADGHTTVAAAEPLVSGGAV